MVSGWWLVVGGLVVLVVSSGGAMFCVNEKDFIIVWKKSGSQDGGAVPYLHAALK